MANPSLSLYDERRMKYLLFKIGRLGAHFVGSGRRVLRPRPSLTPFADHDSFDRHYWKCKRKKLAKFPLLRPF
jgi:hypothetical protein